ncbi:Helicase SEN1 [Tolypocladium ophioglossoides CBS 100239]|uniref:Helicase SEN1 n=1 Tax=Tolypocladium ophioglossoides (strain CBS 100239) TaxID=1163406 RepID=A0A0L0MZS1_TOLOC|nr:Helicase SEN1 [Tolypocladium ophioglossoides CBS 100239]
MAEFNEDLGRWFDELQKIPADNHLLCPKISHDDEENYKSLDDLDTNISRHEKQARIKDAERRIEITYWNSLIFGFEKKHAGKWLDEFTARLEESLKLCSDCVLNWHMKRKAQLQKFSERWNEDAVSHIEDLLNKLDVARIEHNIAWAKQYIEKIEASGATFKKAQFGEHLPSVLISVYEALCCVPYIGAPDQRQIFQYVFMRLQGKSYLKLGTKDPLPGMTFFLMDTRIEDRLKWAQENWKFIESASMTEHQFDWAVSGGLVRGIDDISKKDLSKLTSEDYLDIERFWEGFECILRTLTGHLILSRLRSLEVRPGSPSIYDLLFRHIQFCRSEGVLVVAIRVLTSLLKKSPKAFWDVIGDARPNVIADLLFGSPVYKTLLRQSLENCWSGFDSGSDGGVVPFPISWIHPWLDSLSRDRKYDACEVLMHTLFETLAKDASIGEPGQAACIRAGFDALSFTMKSFLDSETQISSSTTHLYASAAFNLVAKNKDLILKNLQSPGEHHEGWTTFKVADAAKAVLYTAMKLDMKLVSEEFLAIHNNKKLQSTVTRNSKAYWECLVEMFDASSDQVELAKDILACLGRLISVEQIRRPKNPKDSKLGRLDPQLAAQLEESINVFNKALEGIADVLVRVLGRISELDARELSMLFADRVSFQVIFGLSVHDNEDLAEASAEVLKSWTSERSRASSLEHMARLHPEQTLSSLIYTLDLVLQSPVPWGPIRPLLTTSQDILRGLADPSVGVLRTRALDPKLVAIVLRWWNEQWRFVSKSCLNIENWSLYVQNRIMTDFCREIMELAEALIAEDGLLKSVTACGRSDKDAMSRILGPAKENFRGMENMIRLKDRWLVDVTVRVLCKILTRLRENNLEISAGPRKLITDACVPTGAAREYARTTNLNDRQRAELLQALGYEEEVQVVQVGPAPGKEKAKKQSKLDAWSKSATVNTSSSTAMPPRSNRDDVLAMSRSIDSPILKQIEARQAKAKAKVPDAKGISALKESRRREKLEKARRDADFIAHAKRLRGETVPGEDSGIHGLGLTGKAHSRSEIMVNISDEEPDGESDDSDADNQLAALSTGGQKTLDEHELMIQKHMRNGARRPVKKARQQRSVKEMRARLIPPMDRLHNTILAWDIFHDGSDPPNGPAASEVATKYPDPRAYQQTFFPLLASEAWRTFVTAKDELTSQSFGMKIASRASVDSYLEATFTMPIVLNRERGLSEGDILLVSQDESPLATPSAKHCLARVHRITYKKDLVEITYRVASRNNPLTLALTPGVSVHGIKITNMTTIEREYAALESLQYYDLMDEILKAEPSPIIRYGDERVCNAMQNWALNRGQALAVLGAHENDGFTLIQGPPGTGKTKTIVAMVGSLLSDQLAQAATGVPVGVPLRATNAPNGTGQARSKNLLVCAPSNAAVDELVLRLKAGVTTMNGKARKINVLRLGRSDAINAAVKDVTLDELVRARLEGDNTKDKARADREKLHEDAAKIKEALGLMRPRLEEARGQDDRDVYNGLSRQFEDLKRQQMQVGKMIDANKDSGNSIAREMEMRRRQVQQEILNSAHVLCATLSGSGHEMFRNLEVEFETVIIDEAAQCVELSALIPLKYGCCKCILVGDPKQLPPTVLSQSAARFGYDQSLFVRMQQNHPKWVHLLDMQYRMHPEISKFPNREFYEGQLQDGQDMVQLRQKPWHQSALLGAYRFFDVEGVQKKGHRGQSLVNIKELEVAMQIYDTFSKKYQDCDLAGKIGIITPYKAQLFELRSRFKSRYGEGITDFIEFNTTDAFQGRECEIIIFSCVRASSTGGIGFMTDIRRMNVGLTRAKSSLWILGDSRALVQGEFWRKLIHDARDRDRYTRGDILSMLRRPLEPAKPGMLMPAPLAAVSKEVVMSDASGTGRPGMLPTIAPGSTATAAKAGDETRTTGALRSSSSEVVPRSSAGPPVIHTSADKPPNADQRKRRLDKPASGQPGPKRVGEAIEGSTDGERSNMYPGGQRQTAQRAYGQVWAETQPAPPAPRPVSNVGAGDDASGAASSASKYQTGDDAEDDPDESVEWIDVVGQYAE